MLEEFKKFISKGNVADLAVGVIIGGAFGKIVTSLVNDIIMPLIGVILGGINFTHLSFTIGESTVLYGNFIQNIVDFLIVAICVFFFVKTINKLSDLRKKEDKEEKKEEKPVETELSVLKEIANELKKQNKKSNK